MHEALVEADLAQKLQGGAEQSMGLCVQLRP